MAVIPAAIKPSQRLVWTVQDAVTMTRRNLIHIVRVPQLLVFSTIQPVMFILLFTYVFGGAITGLPAGVSYKDYLLPGILVQITSFGAMNTGIGLAEDINKGLIDRFRSLPMSRSAVLAGRTISDLVRNIFTLLLMFGVGSAIGFRIKTGPLQALAAFGIMLAFGYAFSWIGATVGLMLKDPESVQAAGFVWIFPLIFASGLFVPANTMPGWLQGFADRQPVSLTADAVRALVLGGPVWSPVWKALVWAGGISAVFAAIAVTRYRKHV